MTFNHRLVVWMSALLAGAAVSCRPRPQAPVEPPRVARRAPTTRPFTAIELHHVHNVHRVTDKVISGSQPEGEAGMREIAGLGVKTIISVDGITPDADAARKFGMRYVHLPISYDGVPTDRARQIAKAIDELPGNVYIHCHHGKHRSAAAVATACVINGSLAPDRAEEVLKTFGTGVNYKGLWRDARDSRPLDPIALAAVNVEYREKTPIDGLAEAMVKVDHHHDHLKAVRKAGWKAPVDHPDLDPPHEALLLQEALTEAARTPEGLKQSTDFHNRLKSDIAALAELHAALTAKPVDGKKADAILKTVGQSCVSCHTAYRD